MNAEIILNSSLVFVCFIIAFGVIYMISSTRQLAKKKKILAKMHMDMKEGVEVMFGNGLIGTIVSLDEEYAHIRMDKNCTAKVSRYAITAVLHP